MSALCLTPGCGATAAQPTSAYCVPCARHRELLDAVSRARPKPASPHTLGVERLCGNCVWFVLGVRDSRAVANTMPREFEYYWRTERMTWGDCRGNPPRPADEDGAAFPRVHNDDWCRYHQMRRDHHRPGKP